MSLVYHDKSPTFGFSVDNATRTWPDDFDLIAEVNSDDPDAVFELTNSISDHWWKNAGVKNLTTADGARSTSVGDVIVTSQDEVFLVQPVGFKKIGTPDKKIIISYDE